MRNSQATDDVGTVIRADRSHAFEGHLRHVSHALGGQRETREYEGKTQLT